jgi:hypothetical protein
MTEPRPATEAESPRLTQAGRRARRGLVAGYIHELSERHRDHHQPERVLAEPPRGH